MTHFDSFAPAPSAAQDSRATPSWREIAVAALATVAVASIGGELTTLGPWYDALQKPWWQPPDWAFPVAWTAIFVMIAISAVFAWRDAPTAAARWTMVAVFAVNGAFNMLWSGLFFALQRPDWALYEVGFLWLSILLMIAAVRGYSQRAAWLLAPYALWVAFAAALNWRVVTLNAPFGVG